MIMEPPPFFLSAGQLLTHQAPRAWFPAPALNMSHVSTAVAKGSTATSVACRPSPSRFAGPSLSPCIDRRDSGRVFGDMVDTSYRHLWPVGEGLGCRGRRSRSCRSDKSL